MNPGFACHACPHRSQSDLGQPWAMARSRVAANQHWVLASTLFRHLRYSHTATLLRPEKHPGTATLTVTDSQ